MADLVLGILALTLVLVLIKHQWDNFKSSTRGLPYPPGPKPLPIIGNFRDVPASAHWETYFRWAQKYGPLVHFSVFGQHVVVVNSAKVASDLFEKRVYSDRPHSTMLQLMGWTYAIGFLPYGDQWRRQRRLFHEGFRAKASLLYQPLELEKTHELLRNLTRSPKEFSVHFRNFAASIVMQMTYGYQIKPENDRLVEFVEATTQTSEGGVTLAAQILNTFPLLQHLPEWFPGASFKSDARKCREMVVEMKNVPFDFVKNNMASGGGISCLTSELLERNSAAGGGENEEYDIKAVASIILAAGAGTTTASLKSFILAMALYPEAQKKAQTEIDRVIGRNRLPNFEDQDSLVYVEALVREVMRWHPALPTAIPHATSEDDIYEGYFIPKGTTVLGSIWGITRDESIYPNADTFIPERFIKPDGDLNDDVMNVAFGFGRRKCAGLHMARSTVWISIVSMLATFDIARAKDAAGNEIECSTDYTEGMSGHPVPFECTITPRSHAVGLLQETLQK